MCYVDRQTRLRKDGQTDDPTEIRGEIALEKKNRYGEGFCTTGKSADSVASVDKISSLYTRKLLIYTAEKQHTQPSSGLATEY